MVSISCLLITSARPSLTFLEGERWSGLINTSEHYALVVHTGLYVYIFCSAIILLLVHAFYSIGNAHSIHWGEPDKIIHGRLRSLQVSVVHKRLIQLIVNATGSANHFSVKLSLFMCMLATCSGSPPQCSTFSSKRITPGLTLIHTSVV